MNLFENTRLFTAVKPQSLASAIAVGDYVQPVDADRVAVQMGAGIMAAANSVRGRILQAKDLSGTGARALKTKTAQVFTIDLSGHPAHTGLAGKSFLFSFPNASTGVEMKWQLWLHVTNETAPSASPGYTLVEVDVSAGWSDAQILAALRATLLATDVVFACASGVVTITNDTKGYVTAPADVDTSGTIVVTTAGADSSQFILTGALMAEKFTIDFSNAPSAPATGRSFCFSTLTSAGVEHKWQVWFKVNGVGAAPSVQSGYTLAEVDITSWTDAGLAAAIATAVSNEATVSVTSHVATIANAYSGKCSGPVDVNTGSVVTELIVGKMPCAMIDVPLSFADGTYVTLAVELATNATLLVTAVALCYFEKKSREAIATGALV